MTETTAIERLHELELVDEEVMALTLCIAGWCCTRGCRFYRNEGCHRPAEMLSISLDTLAALALAQYERAEADHQRLYAVLMALRFHYEAQEPGQLPGYDLATAIESAMDGFIGWHPEGSEVTR